MDPYKTKNITADLELEIRRCYSQLYSQFEGLSLWVENALKEWCFQDHLLHSCEIRIKTVDSIIKKLDLLMNKDSNLKVNSADEALESINDVIGARLLLYLPSKLENVHTSIIGNKRFKVRKVTAHYKKDSLDSNIREILDSLSNEQSLVVEAAENITGYTGVHYILEAKPIDEIYHTDTSMVYPRFELQVRTLIQHAWSEIQHSVVYKGTSADYMNDMEGKFSVLSDVINNNDALLDRLVQPPVTAPSIAIELAPSSEQESTQLLELMKELVTTFESNDISTSALFSRCKELLLEKQTVLEKIKQFGDDSHKLQVGEFLLKSKHYVEAKKWYEDNCLQDHQYGIEIALLRLVEVCDGLADLKSRGHYLNKLHKNLIDSSSSVRSSVYTGCGYWLWKEGDNDKAIEMSLAAIEASEKEKDGKSFRAKLNHIYYRVDMIFESEENDKKKLDGLNDLLMDFPSELGNDFVESRKFDDLTANQWDTLAWFHIATGYFQHRMSMHEKALKSAKAAKLCLQNCHESWEYDCNKIHDSEKSWLIEDPQWAVHKKQLAMLEMNLGLV